MSGYLWGGSTDIKKQIMKDKRELISQKVGLEGQMYQAENRRKKLIEDLRRAAKENNKSRVTSIGRSYQMLKKHQQQLDGHYQNIEKIDMQKDNILSTYNMMKTMVKTNKSLKGVDNSVDMKRLQKVMDEYEKSSINLELKMETMNDTMDSVHDHGDFAQDADNVIDQIYDELQMDELAQFVTAPKSARARAANTTSETKIDT